MASSSTPSTFAEAMQDTAADLTRAIMLPDADVKFGMQVLTAVIGWNKQKGQGGGGPPGQPGAPGARPPGAPGQPAPGQSAPGAPGGAPAGLQMPGATPGGNVPSPNSPGQGAPAYGALGNGTANLSPNPDELRRMLQSQGAGG